MEVSQKQIDPSLVLLTRVFPSGSNTTRQTSDRGPRSTSTHFWLARSHIRIVWSALLEASFLPSGQNMSELVQAVCPSKRPASLPVATSHKRMSDSWYPPAPARVFPSGEKASAWMGIGHGLAAQSSFP